MRARTVGARIERLQIGAASGGAGAGRAVERVLQLRGAAGALIEWRYVYERMIRGKEYINLSVYYFLHIANRVCNNNRNE